MEENELALRIYIFVPYNISPIQKGIQALHAALRYVRLYGEENPEIYRFIDDFETVVILDGGTTNNNFDSEGKPLGTMNEIITSLQDNNIDIAFFQELDLNDALTAICFLVDERVFNKKDYPDFIDYLTTQKNMGDDLITFGMNKNSVSIEEYFSDEYKEWIRMIGGVKNAFLRNLIKDKKLA